MTIQNTRIVVSSNRPTNSNIYFKVEAADIFISPVSQNDKIVQILNLEQADQTNIKFEIWSYEPHQLLIFWDITLDRLRRNKQFEIKQGQWAIHFEALAQNEKNYNQENRKSKDNKKLSASKPSTNGDRHKNRHGSHYKDVNLAALKKNKDKAAVKKALKHTIECLIKQEKQIKINQDYSNDKILYAKTAKCSPSVRIMPGFKNQSVLFSDYGFDSAEFNRQYAAKEVSSVENEQSQPSDRQLRKRKSKIS